MWRKKCHFVLLYRTCGVTKSVVTRRDVFFFHFIFSFLTAAFLFVVRARLLMRLCVRAEGKVMGDDRRKFIVVKNSPRRSKWFKRALFEELRLEIYGACARNTFHYRKCIESTELFLKEKFFYVKSLWKTWYEYQNIYHFEPPFKIEIFKNFNWYWHHITRIDYPSRFTSKFPDLIKKLAGNFVNSRYDFAPTPAKASPAPCEFRWNLEFLLHLPYFSSNGSRVTWLIVLYNYVHNACNVNTRKR